MLKFEQSFLKQQKENIQKVDELVNRAEMTLAAIKTEFDKYLKTSEQIMKESTKMAIKASKLEPPKFMPVTPPIVLPISTKKSQRQPQTCEECYCDDTASTSEDQSICVCPPFIIDETSKCPNINEDPSKSKKRLSSDSTTSKDSSRSKRTSKSVDFPKQQRRPGSSKEPTSSKDPSKSSFKSKPSIKSKDSSKSEVPSKSKDPSKSKELPKSKDISKELIGSKDSFKAKESLNDKVELSTTADICSPLKAPDSEKTYLQTIYSNSQKDCKSTYKNSKHQNLTIQKMPPVEIPRALVIQKGHQITITPSMPSQAIPVGVVNMGYSEVSHMSDNNFTLSKTRPKNGQESLYHSDEFVPQESLEKEIQMQEEELEDKGMVEKNMVEKDMGMEEMSVTSRAEKEIANEKMQEKKAIDKDIVDVLMADKELQDKITQSTVDKEIQTVDAVLGNETTQMVVQEYYRTPRKYDGINRTERLKSAEYSLASFAFSKGYEGVAADTSTSRISKKPTNDTATNTSSINVTRACSSRTNMNRSKNSAANTDSIKVNEINDQKPIYNTMDYNLTYRNDTASQPNLVCDNIVIETCSYRPLINLKSGNSPDANSEYVLMRDVSAQISETTLEQAKCNYSATTIQGDKAISFLDSKFQNVTFISPRGSSPISAPESISYYTDLACTNKIGGHRKTNETVNYSIQKPVIINQEEYENAHRNDSEEIEDDEKKRNEYQELSSRRPTGWLPELQVNNLGNLYVKEDVKPTEFAKRYVKVVTQAEIGSDNEEVNQLVKETISGMAEKDLHNLEKEVDNAENLLSKTTAQPLKSASVSLQVSRQASSRLETLPSEPLKTNALPLQQPQLQAQQPHSQTHTPQTLTQQFTFESFIDQWPLKPTSQTGPIQTQPPKLQYVQMQNLQAQSPQMQGPLKLPNQNQGSQIPSAQAQLPQEECSQAEQPPPAKYLLSPEIKASQSPPSQLQPTQSSTSQTQPSPLQPSQSQLPPSELSQPQSSQSSQSQIPQSQQPQSQPYQSQPSQSQPVPGLPTGCHPYLFKASGPRPPLSTPLLLPTSRSQLINSKSYPNKNILDPDNYRLDQYYVPVCKYCPQQDSRKCSCMNMQATSNQESPNQETLNQEASRPEVPCSEEQYLEAFRHTKLTPGMPRTTTSVPTTGLSTSTIKSQKVSAKLYCHDTSSGEQNQNWNFTSATSCNCANNTDAIKIHSSKKSLCICQAPKEVFSDPESEFTIYSDPTSPTGSTPASVQMPYDSDISKHEKRLSRPFCYYSESESSKNDQEIPLPNRPFQGASPCECALIFGMEKLEPGEVKMCICPKAALKTTEEETTDPSLGVLPEFQEVELATSEPEATAELEAPAEFQEVLVETLEEPETVMDESNEKPETPPEEGQDQIVESQEDESSESGSCDCCADEHTTTDTDKNSQHSEATEKSPPHKTDSDYSSKNKGDKTTNSGATDDQCQEQIVLPPQPLESPALSSPSAPEGALPSQDPISGPVIAESELGELGPSELSPGPAQPALSSPEPADTMDSNFDIRTEDCTMKSEVESLSKADLDENDEMDDAEELARKKEISILKERIGGSLVSASASRRMSLFAKVTTGGPVQFKYITPRHSDQSTENHTESSANIDTIPFRKISRGSKISFEDGVTSPRRMIIEKRNDTMKENISAYELVKNDSIQSGSIESKSIKNNETHRDLLGKDYKQGRSLEGNQKDNVTKKLDADAGQRDDVKEKKAQRENTNQEGTQRGKLRADPPSHDTRRTEAQRDLSQKEPAEKGLAQHKEAEVKDSISSMPTKRGSIFSAKYLRSDRMSTDTGNVSYLDHPLCDNTDATESERKKNLTSDEHVHQLIMGNASSKHSIENRSEGSEQVYSIRCLGGPVFEEEFPRNSPVGDSIIYRNLLNANPKTGKQFGQMHTHRRTSPSSEGCSRPQQSRFIGISSDHRGSLERRGSPDRKRGHINSEHAVSPHHKKGTVCLDKKKGVVSPDRRNGDIKISYRKGVDHSNSTIQRISAASPRNGAVSRIQRNYTASLDHRYVATTSGCRYANQPKVYSPSRLGIPPANNFSSEEITESTEYSEGEIKCRCNTSIGEIHLCKYVSNIKSRVQFLKRHPKKLLEYELGNPNVSVVSKKMYYNNWYKYYISSSPSTSSQK